MFKKKIKQKRYGLPRERYILHASGGARLALWYRNGILYIGGHVSLRQLVEDIFIVGFQIEPPAWEPTSQICKYRSHVILNKKQFDKGINRIRTEGTIVIEGPVKSIGRIAI